MDTRTVRLSAETYRTARDTVMFGKNLAEVSDREAIEAAVEASSVAAMRRIGERFRAVQTSELIRMAITIRPDAEVIYNTTEKRWAVAVDGALFDCGVGNQLAVEALLSGDSNDPLTLVAQPRQEGS